MKIAYLANSRFPSERAHSVQIVQMCQAFAQVNHKVTLFVSNRASVITEEPETYYDLKFKFNLRRIAVPDIAQYGIKLFYIIAALGFAWGVRKQLKAESYDVLYSRDDWVLLFLSFLLPGVPFVYESHQARFSFASRYIIKRGCQTVVISEGISDDYLKRGVPKEQLCVAHDGIDESFFATDISKADARTRLGIESERPVAMYIGGFDAWKGVETFFAAAAKLPAINCVAIGGTEAEVARYQTQYPAVQFLGSRPYADLKYNQRAADILVIPNTAKNDLSARYTSPLKLFAHMTSGVPLVVSDIPSLRAVVSETHAYFAEADNVDSWVNTLGAVAAEPDISKPQQALQLASAYTWEKRAERITNFMQKICAE